MLTFKNIFTSGNVHNNKTHVNINRIKSIESTNLLNEVNKSVNTFKITNEGNVNYYAG